MRSSMFALCNLYLLLGAIVMTANESGGKQIKVQKIPNDYAVLAESVVGDLHAFKKASFAWPAESTINAQSVDHSRKAVQDACKSTLHWLSAVLHSDFVPQESELQLFPLKSQVQAHDVVRLRYKTDDYMMQVMSTSSGITVIIKDVSEEAPGKPIDIGQAKTYVRQCIDRFLNEADHVKSVSMKNVHMTKHGVEGLPEVEPETCNYWWGLVSWWTDGNTVLFSTGKADGSAVEPTLKKDWLSGE